MGSQRHSGYDRDPKDNYATPEWVTVVLTNSEFLSCNVFEPCPGDGYMVRALRKQSHGVYSGRKDFFRYTKTPDGARDIVTNPPYGPGGRLAVKMIEHALELTKPYEGKVAMLLPVNFDSAKGRRHIFGDHPAFAAKHVLTRRIRWANLEQKAAGPSSDHAWFVWSWKVEDWHPIITYPHCEPWDV